MNQTFAEFGGRAAMFSTCRAPHPFLGREPIFGLVPTFMVWNLVIVVVVALIFWWLVRGSRRVETPLDVLKKRYVSGEIDKKTYLEMKEDIGG
ncbi:MAG: hypothetical protein GF416_04815 [Candidatus Altiarchaeales archaeon]|nr:hypothetical protein [Candidatus Altiarchaeales archaeon]MBD3416442.1 hypothetical protein [Candidatus Altiarchaeales archaeon]